MLGATGQIGWELQRTLAPLGQVISAGRSYGERPVDFGQPGSLAQAMTDVRPDLVVNAAAYTAVEKAEAEPELAQRVNADAVAELGEVAAKLNSAIIHFSTDYVFSGQPGRPWQETDKPAPKNVYGKTKLAGEQALLASGADALILRTSWVYGKRGSNFLVTMQKLFIEKDSLNIVNDQIGAPTWSRMIAEATAQIVAQSRQNQRIVLDDRAGTYHLSAAGETSWYEFALAIKKSVDGKCSLHAVSTDQYPSAVIRPAYSVLDNTKIMKAFGVQLHDWRETFELWFPFN